MARDNCIVDAECPVFPASEQQTASKLLIESSSMNGIAVIGPVEIQIAESQHGCRKRITHRSREITLNLKTGRKTALIIIDLQIVVAGVTVFQILQIRFRT